VTVLKNGAGSADEAGVNIRFRAATLLLLALAAASCGGGGLPAGRTSVFLTIENGAGLALPDDLHVSADGDGTSLYTDQQFPRSGTLAPVGSSGALGTLTIYAPDTVIALRVVVAGYKTGISISEGTVTARLVAGRQVAARLTLSAVTAGGDGGMDTAPADAKSDGVVDGPGQDSAIDSGSGGDAPDDTTVVIVDSGPRDEGTSDLGAACQSSSLAGTSANGVNPVDLTAEGTRDWRFWGPSGATTFKRTAGNLISDYTLVGGGAVTSHFRNAVTFNWTDGSPTLSQVGAADSINVSATVGGGVEIMVPASSTARTLSVYVGGSNDTGMIQASLSDGCVPDYAATATNGKSTYTVVFRLTFKSAVPGTVLRVNWTMAAGFEAIGLYAATLN
jgi:hypothetical protein